MSPYSIGDVLNRLKEEFPDITVSKIRFLEAEGLISPDRTDSGYRKFGDADVDRLRHVLRAQRDRYLPLKVIREELERLDAGGAVEPESPSLPPASDVRPAAQAGLGATDVQLSGRELAEATGLELGDVRGLQEHGLLPAGDRFDGEAVAAARAARGLLQAGLEPRHLRMYRQFADREVGLLGQLVQPMLRQRNPGARARASSLLDDLAAHGTALHAALLRRELRDLLGE